MRPDETSAPAIGKQAAESSPVDREIGQDDSRRPAARRTPRRSAASGRRRPRSRLLPFTLEADPARDERRGEKKRREELRRHVAPDRHAAAVKGRPVDPDGRQPGRPRSSIRAPRLRRASTGAPSAVPASGRAVRTKLPRERRKERGEEARRGSGRPDVEHGLALRGRGQEALRRSRRSRPSRPARRGGRGGARASACRPTRAESGGGSSRSRAGADEGPVRDALAPRDPEAAREPARRKGERRGERSRRLRPRRRAGASLPARRPAPRRGPASPRGRISACRRSSSHAGSTCAIASPDRGRGRRGNARRAAARSRRRARAAPRRGAPPRGGTTCGGSSSGRAAPRFPRRSRARAAPGITFIAALETGFFERRRQKRYGRSRVFTRSPWTNANVAPPTERPSVSPYATNDETNGVPERKKSRFPSTYRSATPSAASARQPSRTRRTSGVSNFASPMKTWKMSPRRTTVRNPRPATSDRAARKSSPSRGACPRWASAKTATPPSTGTGARYVVTGRS